MCFVGSGCPAGQGLTRITMPLFFLLVMLSLSGCSESSIEELGRESLFSIPLGKMEDEIDFFQVGVPTSARNSMVLKDGLVYVGDANSGKIMRFTSYGDLVFLLYNPNLNPRPILLASEADEGQVATKVAAQYAFLGLGAMAVNNAREIYVEDRVSDEDSVKDSEAGVVLNRVVLHFDRYGRLLQKIGQEGVGGTPFSYVQSVHVTDRDELVVITRRPRAWIVYWYSPSDELQYHVEIDLKQLPNSADQKVFPSLEAIIPNMNEHVLYLMLYYHSLEFDESTGTKAFIDELYARIYRLELASGTYDGFVRLPEEGQREVRVGSRKEQIAAPAFELLGVTSTDHFFLIRYEENGRYLLLIMDGGGRVVKRWYLSLEDAELNYRIIRVDASGLLFALLCGDYAAEIVWWRSDRFIREEERQLRTTADG